MSSPSVTVKQLREALQLCKDEDRLVIQQGRESAALIAIDYQNVNSFRGRLSNGVCVVVYLEQVS